MVVSAVVGYGEVWFILGDQMKKKIGGESPTNGAKSVIEMQEPLIVSFTLEGTSDLLFHRWNCEAVAEKSNAAKGSKAKKTDDIESFVYRDNDGFLSIPGEYIRQTCILAAKYKQDPRSSRKSAMDLFKAGIICLTDFSSLGIKDWDYEDRRRVVIQRSAISRIRPAIRKSWTASFDMMINTPEYIDKQLFLEVLANAGRLVGIGDFRPTFGRFVIKSYD